MLRLKGARGVLVVAALSLVSMSAALAQCSISTNGTNTAMMAPEPIVMNDQLTWGVGALTEAIEADVAFGDNCVEIVRGNNILQFQPGNSQGMLNGKSVQFSVEPFSFNGRIFVPVCDVVAAFGGTATWDPNARTLSVVTSGPESVASGFEKPQPVSLQSISASASTTAAATDPAGDPPGDPPGMRGGGMGMRGGPAMGMRGGGMGMGGGPAMGMRGGGMGMRGGPAMGMRGGGFRQVPTGFGHFAGPQFQGWHGDFHGDHGEFHEHGEFHGHEDHDHFPFFLNFGVPFYGGGYPYSYPYSYSYPYNNNYTYCDEYGNCYYYPPGYANPGLNVVVPLHF